MANVYVCACVLVTVKWRWRHQSYLLAHRTQVQILLQRVYNNTTLTLSFDRRYNIASHKVHALIERRPTANVMELCI